MSTQRTRVLKVILLILLIGGAIFIAPLFFNSKALASSSNQGIIHLNGINDSKLHIVYMTDGGVNAPVNPESLEVGSSVVLRDPYKYGFIFMGWYYDSQFTKPVESLTATIAGCEFIYAKWNSVINNYKNVMYYNYSKHYQYCLKDIRYSFMQNLSVPGMPDTREEDYSSSMIFSTDQCPQGLCFTDDYILITSYSNEKGAKGALMVFDRETDQYLITLAMDATSHLGGICFDGSNVWVCNSKQKTIERISYDFINLMVNENRGDVVDASEVVDSYAVNNTPSCITYSDGMIWIASHNVLVPSVMKSYFYDANDDTLDALGSYNIPPRVQGVAFDDSGRAYLSSSYGRNTSSVLYVYDSVVELSANIMKPYTSVEMPPCSEEIDIDEDGNLYVLFESGGAKYYDGTDGNGKTVYPIDQVLVIRPFLDD